MKYLILVMVLFCGSAQADELFDLKVSATILMLADAKLTHSILSYGHGENNIALGKNMSKENINIYFSSAIAGIWAVDLLPKKYRKPALKYVNSLGVYYVNHNFKLGYSVDI